MYIYKAIQGEMPQQNAATFPRNDYYSFSDYTMFKCHKNLALIC